MNNRFDNLEPDPLARPAFSRVQASPLGNRPAISTDDGAAADSSDASPTRKALADRGMVIDAVPVEPSGEDPRHNLIQQQVGDPSGALLSINHQPSAINYEKARALATLCEDFLRLQQEGMSLRQAASALGKSPSWFSGSSAMLARYRRGGIAALLPPIPAPAVCGELSTALEQIGWFIPAARHFYLLSNRTWERGSVPEAVRRALSLPHHPAGWKQSDVRRLLKALANVGAGNMPALPSCPTEIREACLAREKTGQPLVPQRIARQITVSAAAIRHYRNPREAALDFLNSPGGMRLFPDPATGELRLARAGEIIEADDATINFPVCVPWNRDGSDDPCVRRFGVRVARFQWLVSIDAGTSFVPAFSYTARPRSSYRGEDIISLMCLFCRAHGIPVQWRFERGAWESKLVTNAVRNMGSSLCTVYSPHQKPFIEGLFNVLWTKLSVHFPGAHVGRTRGEEKAASDLLTACQSGARDPRRYFPTLATALEVFHEVIAEKNRTPVNTQSHGRWIPEERWLAETAINHQPSTVSALRPLDASSAWLFAPFIRDWTVRGMLVGGRVPVFEGLSVPFDFAAPWLPQYHGARVRCHFDPAEPQCAATLVLLESANGKKAGTVLGQGNLVGDASAYLRMVMGWSGRDATPWGPTDMAGRVARQAAAAGLRREVRAILPRGARGDAVSEERDGLGAVRKIESSINPQPSTLNQPPSTINADLSARESALATFHDPLNSV